MKSFTSTVVLVLASAAPALGTFKSYHVGNSLTYDARPWAVAAWAGGGAVEDHHIRCGMHLEYIWANPAEVCITPGSYGTFNNALPNNAWDAVTLQPHPNPGSTLGGEATAMRNMIDLTRSNVANARMRSYLYATYPTRPESGHSFAESWLSPSSGLDSQVTIQSRDFFEDLLLKVRQDEPGLLMVPVGDVLYALEQEMAAGGRLTGFTSGADFYRDEAHLNNVGRFVAATTFYATLHGDPRDITAIGGDFTADVAMWDSDRTLTPELRDVIQDVTWEVVTSHAYVPEPTALFLVPLVCLMRLRRRRPASA